MEKEARNIKIGYDYDDTITGGLIPAKDGVIITGRYKKDEKELRDFLKNLGRPNIPIYFLPDKAKHTAENIGKFKAQMVAKLEVSIYYEDQAEIAEIIQKFNPTVQVILVSPDEMKYVTITSGWDGMPIAYHLHLEGKYSVIGQVQDMKEIGKEPEEKEDKEERLSQYENMMQKESASELIEILKKLPNKENYFIYFDQNNLWKYSEELLKAGFTKGLFPLKDDFDFEKDRDRAMEFVEENYPEVKIIPFQTAKTVEEAKKMVEESDVPLVIQSMGDHVATICPPDDLEQNKQQILSALDKFNKDYSKGQILLKEKLIQPIEITPQIVFFDGQPTYTTIDLETKNIGNGENNGNQVGCGTNLIISTDFDDRINEIAFPQKVHHMATKRSGLFVWDISLYITEKGIFFGEFCSNRFGYDASMTEMTMSGGVHEYFSAIVGGKNPLQTRFGTAVRVFNLNRQKDVEIGIADDYFTYLYEVKKQEDKFLSVGDCWDLGVITGYGDTVEEAVKSVYKNVEELSFKEKYTRTKEDFLADYPTSIINRYNGTNGVYFIAPEVSGTEKKSNDFKQKLSLANTELKKYYDSEIGKLKKSQEGEIKKLQEEIKSILNVN